MLKWFVGLEAAELVLKAPTQLPQEEQIEVRPENLARCCVARKVDVHLVLSNYFSDDAWMVVEDFLHQKRTNPVH